MGVEQYRRKVFCVRRVVNDRDGNELKYSIQVFDVTDSQLASAVKSVGTKSTDVAKYLKSKA